ncbi:MAG: hypothetical protein K2J37_01230 [Ruminococcus sp.]|nr:hypothetical protein [Ruminococcus sp.]
MIKNNKPQSSKTIHTIYIAQWAFAVIGIILALGAFINGGFLNYIASMIMFYSALIISPIFEMIPALKKYSTASLVPRAIISFVLVR